MLKAVTVSRTSNHKICAPRKSWGHWDIWCKTQETPDIWHLNFIQFTLHFSTVEPQNILFYKEIHRRNSFQLSHFTIAFDKCYASNIMIDCVPIKAHNFSWSSSDLIVRPYPCIFTWICKHMTPNKVLQLQTDMNLNHFHSKHVGL